MPIILELDRAPLLPTRRVPAPNNISRRAETTTLELAVRAERVLVLAALRLDLLAVRVELHVLAEVAAAAFAFAACAAGVRDCRPVALQDHLRFAGFVFRVALHHYWGRVCLRERGDCAHGCEGGEEVEEFHGGLFESGLKRFEEV